MNAFVISELYIQKGDMIMYGYESYRERDQEMLFSIQGVPANKGDMNQLPKWNEIIVIVLLGQSVVY
ncbi:hypothetical protein ACFMB7_29445 (plasmid) [Bacillus toyonensis]